jgi:hypothetical protein
MSSPDQLIEPLRKTLEDAAKLHEDAARFWDQRDQPNKALAERRAAEALRERARALGQDQEAVSSPS